MVSTKAVELSQVTFGYGSRELLAIDSFSIEERQIVSILGPSGCGKTTVLLIVAGLLRPRTGSISLWGETPETFRAAGRCGFVFQEAALLPWRSAASNVSLPFQLQGLEPDHHAITEALAAVRLQDARDLYPDQLSGGMRSRVSVARALVTRPKLLLCDEAFGSLDEYHRLQLDTMLRDIRDQFGTTILFVTHNIQEAVLVGDRVVVIDRAGDDSVTRIQIDMSITLPKGDPRAVGSSEFQAAHASLLNYFLTRPA